MKKKISAFIVAGGFLVITGTSLASVDAGGKLAAWYGTIFQNQTEQVTAKAEETLTSQADKQLQEQLTALDQQLEELQLSISSETDAVILAHQQSYLNQLEETKQQLLASITFESLKSETSETLDAELEASLEESLTEILSGQ